MSESGNQSLQFGRLRIGFFSGSASGKVGLIGHFVACEHAMRNYQNACYEPKVSCSDNV